MANSSTNLPEGEIREGYLCPICLSDLRNVSQLQEHFELVHPSEDHDVLQTLKGFFDKAKRKILKRETAEIDSGRSYPDSEPITSSIKHDYKEYSWPAQDIGKTRCHKNQFIEFRKQKIDYYDKESNKLLIRLAKLLNDVSCDTVKRKELENNVITWVKNSDVPLCPSCGKSFGLSRRWHHCRLCGFVMCKSCSHFISYEFVQKIVDSYMSESQSPPLNPSSSLRKPSAISFTGLLNPPTDPQIRICGECDILLQRRDQKKEKQNYYHPIVQLYERMREHQLEIESVLPQYIDMIESLNSGETEYQLQDVQELKAKISRLAERLAAYSKKILNLQPLDQQPTDSTDQQPGPSKLQTAIHSYSTQYLRNNVISLPPPPTQKELEIYQRERLQNVYRRIQKEKEEELQQFQNSKSPSPEKMAPTPPHSRTQPSPITPDTGWCVSTDGVSEDSDLMVQQMNLIRRYIQQAKQDRRYDEVRMLEANLEELELEHSKQLSLRD